MIRVGPHIQPSGGANLNPTSTGSVCVCGGVIYITRQAAAPLLPSSLQAEVVAGKTLSSLTGDRKAQVGGRDLLQDTQRLPGES